MTDFYAPTAVQEITDWIKEYFNRSTPESGKTPSAVVLLDGNLPSLITAILSIKSLGAVNVYLLTNSEVSKDYITSVQYVLGIPINTISFRYISYRTDVTKAEIIRSSVAYCYSVADYLEGKVANTLCLTENWIGCGIKGGNCNGDFSPLADITVSELLEIAEYLNIPSAFMNIPHLNNLSYSDIDNYIRDKDNCGVAPEIIAEIDKLHYANIHKLKLAPKYSYRPDRLNRKEKANEITHSESVPAGSP